MRVQFVIISCNTKTVKHRLVILAILVLPMANTTSPSPSQLHLTTATPELTMKQDGVYYSTDSTILLQCDFRGVRKGQVTWSHEGQELGSEGDVDISSETSQEGKQVGNCQKACSFLLSNRFDEYLFYLLHLVFSSKSETIF